MTTPSPIQSLASIISAGSQAGLQPDAPAAAQNSQALANGPASPQVSTGVVGSQQLPANGQPVQPTQPVQQTQPANQTPPVQKPAGIRGVLVESGYDIPENMTDDEVLSSVVDNLNKSFEIQGDREFQEYRKNREEFLKFSQAQQAQQPAQTPQPQTTQQQAPVPAIPAEQLLHAVTVGAITRGADGKWAAQNPAYSSYAQAMTEKEEKTAQVRVSMAANPEEFVQRAIADALEKQSQKFAELQKPILEQLEQARVHQEKQVVNGWVQENKSKLFTADGQLTPYGKLYQKLESDIEEQNPAIGLAERHQRVLQYVSLLDQQAVQPAPAPTPAAVPNQPAAPQQTFMQKVGQNRNGTNRLSEYEGPASNAVTPQIPLGKSGLPDLEKIIAKQNQN